MNKNLIAVIGLVLVSIIGYQAYLLSKKDGAQKVPVQEVIKKPKITVTIDKETSPVMKQIRTAQQTSLHPNLTQDNTTQPLLDETKIKDDLSQLFNDIFGNPKVQKEIQTNMTQLQSQLQEGMQEFQKQLFQMTNEFQNMTGDDELLKGLFKNFNMPQAKQFTDKTDHYYLQMTAPGDENTTIDVSVKGQFLRVISKQLVIEDHNESGVISKKEVYHKKQMLVIIPQDADVQKLETKYNDGLLEIIIPKLPKPAS